MSETFYLKYRPQKLADLDLTEVRQQLKDILSSKNLPHAFLFTGPKGAGKTSSARILAKSVNCPKSRSGQAEPCNKCSVCRAVSRGQAIDLIEIDAASNRGIDDIRSLKERIKLSPSQFKYKVYIIDEVHMLTKEAFNALLKTLEEPPQHALFVLCTTEAYKLPATIVSRCLQINFRKANKKEINRCLKRVVKGEKLKISQKTLDLINQASDGSFRDAVKILEQLSFSGPKISFKKAEQILAVGQEKIFLRFIEKNQLKKALLWLEKQSRQGLDFNLFGRSLLVLLHDIWLNKKGLNQSDPGSWRFSEAKIKKLIEIFSSSVQDSKRAVISQLPFELAVSGLEAIDYEEEEEEEDSLKKPKKTKPISSTQIKKIWQEILNLLKSQNHSLTALLKSAQPLKIKDKLLVIKVFYPFHKNQLETDKCRRLVESAACQALSRQVRVDYILAKQSKRPNPKKPKQTIKKKSGLADAAEEIFNN